MTPPVKIQFRLPPKLHVAMTRLAKASHRSLNSEVVIAIENYVITATNVIRADSPRKTRKPECTLDKTCQRHPYEDGGAKKGAKQ